MKTTILVLGLVLAQAANALPNAAQRFNSLLPFGTHNGDDCQVRVSRTLRGNIKVSASHSFRQMSFVILKNQYYRYVPGEYYSVSKETQNDHSKGKDYLYFSSTQKGDSVLIGKSLYSPEVSYTRQIECVLY